MDNKILGQDILEVANSCWPYAACLAVVTATAAYATVRHITRKKRTPYSNPKTGKAASNETDEDTKPITFSPTAVAEGGQIRHAMGPTCFPRYDLPVSKPDTPVQSGIIEFSDTDCPDVSETGVMDPDLLSGEFDSKEDGPETKDISQLLSVELDNEQYSLIAKVETVHTTACGYAGLLSDGKARMPFVYTNEETTTDGIAGVLLHESKDKKADLEFRVVLDSPFEEDTSRTVLIQYIKGKIGDLEYEAQKD